MPNPFSQKSIAQPQVSVVEVVNSTLVCEQCYEEVRVGKYYEEKELLTFTCSNKHWNEVKISL